MMYILLHNHIEAETKWPAFSNDIFKCVFVSENIWFLIKISLNCALKGPIDNIPALVQTMAPRRPGDKSLSEPMWPSILTHICVTRRQWVTRNRIDFDPKYSPILTDKQVCIYRNMDKQVWKCDKVVEYSNSPWWRHQMKTFSVLLALCAGNSSVTGEFPSQRPLTRSFDVFFDLRLNKRLSK